MKIRSSFILAAVSLGLLPAADGDVVVPTNWKQSNAFNSLRLASNLSNATGMDGAETILYNHDGQPVGEPNNANNSQLLTSAKANPNTQAGRDAAMAAGKVWIIADLGASYDLTTIRIWNWNWDNTPGTPLTSLNNRGVSQFDIFVRNTAADTADGTVGGTPINPSGVSDATNALTDAPVFNPGTIDPWTSAISDQALAVAPNDDTYTGESFNLAGQTARFIAIRVDGSYLDAGGVGLGKVRIEGTAGSDTSPPGLVIKNPADDSSDVAIGSNLVATFNEMIQPGSGSITIKRTSDNSVVESFNVATSTQLTFPPGSAQVNINPTANLVAGIEYYVQIDGTAIKDLSGNFYAGIVDPDTTSWGFTTDSNAPLLAITAPVDDAPNVATGANLVATFNEVIRAGTGNITIKRTSDNSVVESFNVASSPGLTFSNAQVTIDPSSNLVFGIDYYVQIDSTAIVDLSGNFYAGIVDPDTTTWSFTTDNTPPTLTSLSPATPTVADPGTRLLAQFDEPVQAGTGTVTIRKASDDSLVETIDMTTPGAVATHGSVIAIVRSVALEPNTAYYVNAPAGAIQDVSGNPAAAITGTSAWTFTTSAAVPIVMENFNDSSSPLNATAADTFAEAIINAGGSYSWVAANEFLENGAVSGTVNSGAHLNLGAYINNTKGTAAGKFDLTMTIAEASTAWVSLGFVGSSSPSTAGNFTTIAGAATIIYRGQNGVASPNVNGEIDMFGGFGNTNGVDGPDSNTGFHTLTVSLDLTPAGGYNGTDNFGTVTWSDSVLGTLGSYTYTANRNFNSILITQAVSTGTINALALYQTGATGITFANWISGFSVDGMVGVDDDFDNDGLGNAVENLLGTSPEEFNQGLTTISSSGGNLVFRHTLSATPASDLTGAYEWSTDLVTWNADEASSGGTTVTFGAPVVITPGTPDLVEVTATVTGTPASKVFARFMATQN